MRVLFVFSLLTLIFYVDKVNGQMIGKYQDHFASSIELHADSTFKYNWAFDLQSSWSKGKWHCIKDIIYFQVVPIYDTLYHKDFDGKMVLELKLSVDTLPNKRISEEVIPKMVVLPTQNVVAMPDKLFFKKNRLYVIKEGKLLTKRYKQFWTGVKVNPWYEKRTN